MTSRGQLEQRRRSQVRADAGSLPDPLGACGACDGGGAAAAESPRPPSHRDPVTAAGSAGRAGAGVSRLLDVDVGRSHGDPGRAAHTTRDARTEQAAGLYPSLDRRNIRVGISKPTYHYNTIITF